MLVVDFVVSVKLIFSKNLLAPLQEVIEKKFMKCVENFGNKEGGYFTMQPVSPEWKMDSGQQKVLAIFWKLSRSHRSMLPPMLWITVSNKTVPMLHTFGMIGEYWQNH